MDNDFPDRNNGNSKTNLCCNHFHKMALGEGEICFMDTHVHTSYSDGTATVGEVEEACLGLDIGCCITDHNEIRGAVALWERKKIPTMPAIELGSKELIEILVFFRDGQALESFYREHVEPFRKNRLYSYLARSLDHLVAGAREHDVLITFPHPFAPLWKNIRYGKKRQNAVFRVLDNADCIEVLNGALTKRANRRALNLCQRLDKVPLGGSDSHRVGTIGSVMVALDRNSTSTNLFDTVKNGRVFGLVGPEVRSNHVSNTWHMVKRHTQKLIMSQGAFPRV